MVRPAPRSPEGTGREIQISVHGVVGQDLSDYVAEHLQPLVDRIAEPVHLARLHVVAAADRARDRAVEVRLEVDVDGDVLHSHAEAERAPDAVDLLHDRLGAQLEHRRSRRLALRHRSAAPAPTPGPTD